MRHPDCYRNRDGMHNFFSMQSSQRETISGLIWSVLPVFVPLHLSTRDLLINVVDYGYG